MRAMGDGDLIYIFLSDKYLRSSYCMFELNEIWRNSRQEEKLFRDRVRFYALPDARYVLEEDWVFWAAFWKNRHKKLRKLVAKNLKLPIKPVVRRMEITRTFYNQVADILQTLCDSVTPRNFEEFLIDGFAKFPQLHYDGLLPADVSSSSVLGVTAHAARLGRDHSPIQPLFWANGKEEDNFGEFARLAVDGATQTMRWIRPGTFLMGSPEDEPGRAEHEGPQQQVTLSAGFWLFDSPCTQALWEAVMGHNPSRFKSPDRPVERVSWSDCQSFIARINRRFPGLGLMLPTEAQWEYACRAGTGAATYIGPSLILGANNAPLLDPIAWYGGNSGVAFDLENGTDSSNWPDKQYPHAKAGTHMARQKMSNAWGLHDMLGNVWEWCADGERTYNTTPVVDPFGRAEVGAERVLRGGSWIDDAGYCRSASRMACDPSIRDHSIGFRCACVCT